LVERRDRGSSPARLARSPPAASRNAEGEIRGAGCHALLVILWNQWNAVFSSLGQRVRTHVSELRDVRNRWAHQVPFTAEDAQRAMQTVALLLRAISSPQASEATRMGEDLLGQRFRTGRRDRRATISNTISPVVSNGTRGKRMSCRDEILDCVRYVTQRAGRNEFTLKEILDCMRARGTQYKESTIRTHVTSRMCSNAPDHHARTYDDFVRTDRGTYCLRR